MNPSSSRAQKHQRIMRTAAAGKRAGAVVAAQSHGRAHTRDDDDEIRRHALLMKNTREMKRDKGLLLSVRQLNTRRKENGDPFDCSLWNNICFLLPADSGHWPFTPFEKFLEPTASSRVNTTSCAENIRPADRWLHLLPSSGSTFIFLLFFLVYSYIFIGGA